MILTCTIKVTSTCMLNSFNNIICSEKLLHVMYKKLKPTDLVYYNIIELIFRFRAITSRQQFNLFTHDIKLKDSMTKGSETYRKLYR